jgi:uncharacterized protein YkwD
MTRNNTHRRTALKLLGTTGLGIAGLSGSAAGKPGDKPRGKQYKSSHSGEEPDDPEDSEDSEEEDENEDADGGGLGHWCAGAGYFVFSQGRGYQRDHPHWQDDTRWDDWEPGDGKPPWAGEEDDDGEEEDEDDDDDDDEDGEDNGGPPGDDEDWEPGDGEPPWGDDDDEDEDDEDTDGPEDDEDADDGDEEDDESDAPPEDDDSSEDDEDAQIATQIEQRIHGEVNAYRDEQGLDGLEYNEDLADVARAHSEDMLENDYFDHDSPDGTGPGERLDEAGLDCNAWGENIAWESSQDVSEGDADSIADSTVEGWINSEGHRQNLLGNYDEEGLGAAVGGGEVYITQLFCSF